MNRAARAIIVALLGSSALASADEHVETYIAHLSERDHFNSSGERLTNAAAIIRQDRANYHRYNKRDAGDTGDAFFSSAKNREILERLLNKGSSAPSALRKIVNGTPMIVVKIYQADSGEHYIDATIHE